MSGRPIRVLHVITRMIIGGAQENTMLSCALIDPERFPSTLLTGVETGPEGSLHDECRARGVKIEFEPALVRAVDPWRDLRAADRLTRAIREGGYDVVHTHSSKAGILGRIAARRARAPVVVHTAHGWPFSRPDPGPVRSLWIALERRYAPRCDALIVVGSRDREDGLKLGIGRPEQYRLIRSGFEIEAFRGGPERRAEARRRLGIPGDAYVVGSVGRLSAQKAPLDLMEAFRRFAAGRPEAHLSIVGDGPLRPEVERFAAAHGLASRLSLPGLRQDVADLIPAFDVFTLTSRWEGLPRVIPQAMAAGLPVVATPVGAVEDAVADGETGRLVAPGDVAGFAARWEELARDPERARAMGERGRERAGEFSARRMVDQLAALYEECVARRSGAAGA